MFLTDFISGGSWFLPLIIVCLVFGIVATYAKKTEKTKLEKIVDSFAYLLMLVMLIISWILYFRGEYNFISSAIWTVVVIYLIASQLLKQFDDRWKEKYGVAIFHRINMAATGVYILLVALLILMGSHFTTMGWLITGIFLVIAAGVSYIFQKSEQ